MSNLTNYTGPGILPIIQCLLAVRMFLILFSGLPGEAEAPGFPAQQTDCRSLRKSLHTGRVKEGRGETHTARAEDGQIEITILIQEGNRTATVDSLRFNNS